MEDKIDLIIGGIFFLFFVLGCFKGFLKSVFGPLSLIGCWIYALHYYNQTQKILISIGIAILGPIILGFCFSLILKILKNLFNKDGEISAMSRFLGGVINMAWSGSYLILMMLLAVMIPVNNPKFTAFKDALKNSTSYYLAKTYIGDNISLFTDLEQVSSTVEDPQKLKKISESERFQDLLKNSKVQNLYEDPEIQKLIDEKNYSALITNPKIQALLKDKELMLEFTAIINEQSREEGNMTEMEGETPEASPSE